MIPAGLKLMSCIDSASRSFKPEWDAATKMIDGLHWAAVDIDDQMNLDLAKRHNVLTEGIPNVKLINTAGGPHNVVRSIK